MNDIKRLKVCVDRSIRSQRLTHHFERSIAENPRNQRTRSRSAEKPVAMASDVGRVWGPNRTLRVKFLDGDPAVQERIAVIACEWTSYASIKFKFVESGDAEIRISLTDRGSWSYVGTEALSVPDSSPTMNYGWLDQNTPDIEYRRVVLHEFGHALGCIHEHQAPTATELRWDKAKVYEYFGGSPNFWPRDVIDRNIFYHYNRTATQFTVFDPTSIMMYRFPAELFIDGFSTPQNDALSASDKLFIAKCYPGVDWQPTTSTLTAALEAIDTDRITPFEALQQLVRLQKFVAPRGAGAAVPRHDSRANGADSSWQLRGD